MNAVVELRAVTEDDLEVFREQQSDPAAVRMAAFHRAVSEDRDAFVARWRRLLADESVQPWTIVCDGRVAGHVVGFERLGEREVSYWIGREFWGRGVATAALAAFLERVTERPLYARAARDNRASLRVLEKCGFVVERYERAFAEARGREIEEALLVRR